MRSTVVPGLLIVLACALFPNSARADLVVFDLHEIFTDRGGQMTGQFTWTFDPGDFENGQGEFTELDVPHTNHGLEDLIITIETKQIEITLDGSFHDDGVDVILSLQEPFSPDGPVDLDLDPTESRYSIGGNGFLDGGFVSGSINPVVVPEPSPIWLLCAASFYAVLRRRKKTGINGMG